MATPIGHGLVGLSLFWAAQMAAGIRMKALLWLAVLFALLPDFDFIPGILLGKPAAYHHGISHSVGFGMAVAAIGALIARQRIRRSFGFLFLLLFSCYASHLLLDFFGTDSRPPYGLPIFWPLSSDHYLSPIPLFPGVRHVRSTDGQVHEWVQGVLSWQNLQGIVIEILLILPFALALWWRQSAKRVPRTDKAGLGKQAAPATRSFD